MSKLNVTNGEWIVNDIITEKGSFLRVTTEGESICNITTRSDVRSDGNAMLICDAANTYNKTGFTPSELAQQVEEMREALNELLYCCETYNVPRTEQIIQGDYILTKYPKK